MSGQNSFNSTKILVLVHVHVQKVNALANYCYMLLMEEQKAVACSERTLEQRLNTELAKNFATTQRLFMSVCVCVCVRMFMIKEMGGGQNGERETDRLH